MNNLDALRISQQRDAICENMVEKFREHMRTPNIDDGMALADEFFEWLNPDMLDNEQTSFYNEHELQERYDELTRS
tara:strand:- start:599 stop:826 length:228 start_codon:yes stop_codon:yes gene_type:complete